MNILLTRPRHQSEQWQRRFAAYGIESTICPCIDILPPTHPENLRCAIQSIRNDDYLFFVSQNAVEQLFSLLSVAEKQHLQHCQCFTIGATTAKILATYGFKNIMHPSGNNHSEALLALPSLHCLNSKHGHIFRGETGREHLANTLKKRGAQVHYHCCYRRQAVNIDINSLQKNWHFDYVIFTCFDALKNLWHQLGTARTLLQKTPITVTNKKMQQFAEQHGMTKIELVNPPGFEQMLSLLRRQH